MQLTGPNGSGKTSLLRLICRLLRPTNGDIRWNGASITTLGEDFFLELTYLGHRPALKDELTPAENLRISGGLKGAKTTANEVSNCLRLVGLTGCERLPVRLLSEGQKRRVMLAHLILSDTNLWLLDEILTSLDNTAVDLVLHLIGEHLQKGGIAIVSTHQELKLSASSFQRLELAS
jgi:heme exporter protein A